MAQNSAVQIWYQGSGEASTMSTRKLKTMEGKLVSLAHYGYDCYNWLSTSY